MLIRWLLVLSLVALVLGDGCARIRRELRYPCRCQELLGGEGDLALDCDFVVFPGEFPTLPHRAPVVSFSQRWVGHQNLPMQAFANAGWPLRVLDFSGNSLRRLTDRLLAGLEDSLVELRLADNLLGDSLNPIFSSSELHNLAVLRVLDLSGNQIKGLEEGLLKGCDSLKELWLERNSLTSVPSSSLHGPTSLRLLSLVNNRISSIPEGAFLPHKSLETVNLKGNMLSTLDGGAFRSLSNLRKLNIAHNKLKKLNSDVFAGAENIHSLDLSENFLLELPTEALKIFEGLRHLNLSSNLIERLDDTNLVTVTGLESLDLSRNNIANIAPGTFLGLRRLKHLDLSINTLRTVEDDAFEGLDSLETLSLQDNNILLVPASALGRLSRLNELRLDFNRVAALSVDILRAIADRVTHLGLSRNVVRELPSDAFQDFKQLQALDLSGNLLLTLESPTFSGLEETLQVLNMRGNKISSLPFKPLALTNLKELDLSNNLITEVPRMSFSMVPSLTHLNLSRNPQLGSVPTSVFHPLINLEILDLSHTGLKVLSPELLMRSLSLKWLSLANNLIQDITESVFQNLANVTYLDLSNNHISNVRTGSFSQVSQLRKLNLKGNRLTSFKGEFFVTRRSNGTLLEELILDENELSYLFPSSFRVHPRLKTLSAARNKFNFFPAELIVTLNYLQEIDLSSNLLKGLEEFDFGRLPRLRVLKLNYNQLDSISETAFHNSTQLQIIDLAGNKLERLGERTFQGLGRLKLLNLRDNSLSELPDSIFERSRLRMLENIDLSGNLFDVAPLKTLQRQYFFLMSVDLSRNKLREIPPDDSIMVNIKRLDLSFNPLSQEAITSVLGEPKTVRELNMAGTGIIHIPVLETPFLHLLNLSHNSIADVPEKAFERPTLLESLDLSHNKISDISVSLSQVWPKLKNLQTVDLSSNPIKSIVQGDLDSLESLQRLKISMLEECTRLEKMAFRKLGNLAELEAYGYPKLGYLDVSGLLYSLPALEALDVEVKDSAVGSDQLSAAMNPRLAKLGIRGLRIQSISSGALAGLKSSEISVELKNTSLNTLPPALLIPLPRSSKVILDVTGSQLTTLTAQFLTALDDRRGDLSLVGLSSNPILCDCGVRALRRSPLAQGVNCTAPTNLAGRVLVEIADDELTCNPQRQTTSTPITILKSSRTTPRITTEPEIIWSLPPTTTSNNKILVTNKAPTMVMNTINNDDKLIISIVGGVVAFILVLIIVICVVRLRWSDNQYRGGPLATVPSLMQPHCNNPACPCPKMPLYSMQPIYGPNPGYAATLPHKMGPPPSSVSPALRASYSTLGRVPNQPFYVSFPPDEKEMSLR